MQLDVTCFLAGWSASSSLIICKFLMGVSTFPSCPLNCHVSTTDRFRSGPWRRSLGTFGVRFCMYELNTLSKGHSNGVGSQDFQRQDTECRLVQDCANMYISLTGPILFCRRGMGDRVWNAYLEMLGNLHGICSPEATLESETKEHDKNRRRTKATAEQCWCIGCLHFRRNVVNFHNFWFFSSAPQRATCAAHLILLTAAWFNLLKPNDIYICRTAALTSRRYILYFIFIQQIHILNILNMLHNLRLFLFKMPFISQCYLVCFVYYSHFTYRMC